MATFADAEAALGLFADTEEPWEIVAALPTQDVDAGGDVVDVVDVSWRIKGKPGTFTVHVPYDQSWDATAVGFITQQYLVVEAIYAGLADSAMIGGGDGTGGGTGGDGGPIGPGPVLP